jgi:hypothetical protein
VPVYFLHAKQEYTSRKKLKKKDKLIKYVYILMYAGMKFRDVQIWYTCICWPISSTAYTQKYANEEEKHYTSD